MLAYLDLIVLDLFELDELRASDGHLRVIKDAEVQEALRHRLQTGQVDNTEPTNVSNRQAVRKVVLDLRKHPDVQDHLPRLSFVKRAGLKAMDLRWQLKTQDPGTAERPGQVNFMLGHLSGTREIERLREFVTCEAV
jgi:hypothetical protein